MQDPISGGTGNGAPPTPSPAQQSTGTSTAPAAPASSQEQHDNPGSTGPATQSVTEQAKQRLTGALEGQKSAAAEMVEQLAETMERSGEPFKGRQDWIASAIGRGADELNTLARSLRDKDLGALAGEIQTFARQQPALFVGAALAAGFAVARLGKVAAADLSRDDLPSMPEVGHGDH